MTDGEILRQIRDKDCIDDVLVKEDKLEDTQVIPQTEIPIPKKEAPKKPKEYSEGKKVFRKWKLEGKELPKALTRYILPRLFPIQIQELVTRWSR